MKEILDILRQELVLCTRSCEISSQQQTMLAGQIDDASVDAIVHMMDPILLQMQRIEQRKDNLLLQFGHKTLQGLLDRQPLSAEKTLAGHLMEKLTVRLEALQRINRQNQMLLQKQREYIDFSINVIMRISTGTIYASCGNVGSEITHVKKIFDQTV
jgi:flagellar biosynthesis/type III secretory pathway chaperone